MISDLSSPHYDFSPSSHGSHGQRHSGITTPGSSADEQHAYGVLAQQNLDLMKLGPYPALPPSESTAVCFHKGAPDKFHTCSHPYHSSYHEGNLPLILFRLEPYEVDTPLKPLGHLVEGGQAVLDYQGTPIRNFSFLPRYISVRPSGWLMEFWMRSDPRLTYRDIKARMPVTKEELPSDNVLNMRRERDARKPLGLSCWTARRGGVTRAEIERVELLCPENITYNTALKVRHDVQPPVLESKSLYPSVPPHFYPLDSFLDSGRIHAPGRRLNDGMQLLFSLQDSAIELGIEHWRSLPESKLPDWWIVKGKGSERARSQGPFAKSAAQTPKSARTRMNWKTPQRPALSKTHSRQDSVEMTPVNSQMMTPLSTPLFDSGLFEVTTPIQQTGSHKVNLGEEIMDYSSPLDIYQTMPGFQHAQTPSKSGLSQQDVEMGMNSYQLPAEPAQVQDAHRALFAALQGSFDAIDDDPYFDIFPRLQNNIDYSAHFGDLAMQVFQHNQTSYVHSTPNEVNISEMYPFNGHIDTSVRQNQGHVLHTNMGEIMNRNNPFDMMGENGGLMSPRRSFETFLAEDLPF
ncbi:hypothetical protein LOZ66_000685 [Ophidiomyces ophidiicola]|nr:hypothetical protein LOZ66_000685 [Ophidiomyces ophidiicola]